MPPRKHPEKTTPTPPGNDVAAKLDPEHTDDDFLRDLEKATSDGRYFGDAFEPDALKKRRAYKKWCELLLQPELSTPLDGSRIRQAEIFLDHLRLAYGYDVVDHLRERFGTSDAYQGRAPYIERISHTHSWHDANQCLQLTDMLLGCIKQAFRQPRSGPRTTSASSVWSLAFGNNSTP